MLQVRFVQPAEEEVCDTKGGEEGQVMTRIMMMMVTVMRMMKIMMFMMIMRIMMIMMIRIFHRLRA